MSNPLPASTKPKKASSSIFLNERGNVIESRVAYLKAAGPISLTGRLLYNSGIIISYW